MASLLLTGATGFLGKILYRELSQHFEVTTLGRSADNALVVNLERDIPQFTNSFERVVHNAGMAHKIPRNTSESQLFYAVNYQGTLNLLKGLEGAPALPRLFVFISTVAVYGLESGENIDEQHPLSGTSPYAESKILAEAAIQQWCGERNVRCMILRLPLVVAPNPPGNLGAMIRAIRKGYYLAIRNNFAAKSMVGAQDVAAFLRSVSEVESSSVSEVESGSVSEVESGSFAVQDGIYNLTDGIHPTFCEVEAVLEKVSGRKIRVRIPLWVARVFGKCGDLMHKLGLPAPLTSDKLNKITTSLTFDDGKARRELGWEPGAALRDLVI
ncbi:MAG: NAD-dependent epimerase/dehydratase family protein [Saprospiraceae bacterium]